MLTIGCKRRQIAKNLPIDLVALLAGLQTIELSPGASTRFERHMSKSYWLSRLRQATARGQRRANHCICRKRKRYRFSSRPTQAFSVTPSRPSLPYDESIKHLLRHASRMTPQRVVIPATYSKRPATLKVPRHFSLTHAPAESYLFLCALIRFMHKVPSPQLLLDYHDCVQPDLDASVCMDAILRLFIEHHCIARIRLGKKGRACSVDAINMNHDQVRRFFYSTGAHRSVKGHGKSYDHIISCPLKVSLRDPARKGRNEVTITDLLEHLQKCLARFGKKLTAKDEERFGDIIGEVLANAEEHSSLPLNYAIAHFEEYQDEAHSGRFQIVIFNFGQTIYERLNDANACLTKDTILPQMRDLSTHYNRKNLFGFGKAPFQEECLWTLFALQDGVSSISNHRGTGSTQFITDFLALRSKAPNKKSLLTLMSGNTRIQFDGSYLIHESKNAAGETHRRITFNQSNSLSDPPDPKVVTFAPAYFPGTLLYADIILTDDHLQAA